uniref:SRA stem-loop interacting RNA binding protein n=1 Tax=Neogobius melanostomus TaxID=47308 RepID=A0A8C6WKE1_9GOBI
MRSFAEILKRVGEVKMAASSKKVFEVFVSRVPWTVASKEMREYFRQFGQLRRCFLPFDKETGFHKGYCWVAFSSEEGMINALQKEPHMMDGAKVQVQKNRQTFIQSWNKDED